MSTPELDVSMYPESVRGKIKLCSGPCQRPTRPSHVRKYLAPDTVVRQAGGLCQTCLKNVDVTELDPEEHARLKEQEDEAARRRLAATVNSVAAYTLGRRRRIAERNARMRNRRLAS